MAGRALRQFQRQEPARLRLESLHVRVRGDDDGEAGRGRVRRTDRRHVLSRKRDIVGSREFRFALKGFRDVLTVLVADCGLKARGIVPFSAISWPLMNKVQP